MKFPAWQFYPGDWKKDPGVQALDYFTRGIWFEILLLMFEAEERGKLTLNGAAMPEEALAQSLGLDKQILTTALTKILQYGCASKDPSSGVIVCRRMVRDENIRKIRQKAGKQGGNPLLLNQNQTTKVNQKSTPSVSSSVSSSEGTNVRQKFKKPSIDEMKLNAAKIGLPESEAISCWNYYESNGWRVGANPMKSWPAAMQNWKRNYDERRYQNNGRNGSHRPDRNSGTANAGRAERYDYATIQKNRELQRQQEFKTGSNATSSS